MLKELFIFSRCFATSFVSTNVIKSMFLNIILSEEKEIENEEKEKYLQSARQRGVKSNLIIFDHGDFPISSVPFINLPYFDSYLFVRKDMNNFTLHHELTHIERSHGSLISPLFYSLSLYSALRLKIRTTTIISSFSYLVKHFFENRNEKEADIEACKHISLTEIAEGIEFFGINASQKKLSSLTKRDFLESIKYKCFYDKNGESRFDVHPTGRKRIDYMKKVLFEREKKEEPYQMTLKLSLFQEEKEFVISEEIASRIRNILRNSERGNVLFLVKSFILSKNLKVETYNNTERTYEVNQEKIDRLIQTEDVEDLIPILEEIATLRNLMILHVNKSVGSIENVKEYLASHYKNYQIVSIDEEEEKYLVKITYK